MSSNKKLLCQTADFETDVIKLHVCTEEELVGRQIMSTADWKTDSQSEGAFSVQVREIRSYTSQDYIKHYHINQLVLSCFRWISYSVSFLTRIEVIHSLISEISVHSGWAGYMRWINHFRNDHYSVENHESHFNQALGFVQTTFQSSIQHGM